MRQLILPLIFLALLAAGCTGPKALTKRGMELHNAGMVKQAAELYYQALRKKPQHVDAMVGLRAAGQGVIDTWVADFQKASMDGRRSDALGLYDEMSAYTHRMAGVNVDLIIPSAIVKDYEDHLDEHLIELNDQGHEQMNAEDFEAAAATWKEIIHLDPEYGDAQALLIIAQAEPQYRAGTAALETQRYRAAYDALGRALAFDNDYKDAVDLRSTALKDGRFNLAILNFDGSSRDRDVALDLRSNIQNGLLQTSDPFIGVVDRTQSEEIMAEQELSISGLSDEQVEVGEIAGARAILTGSLLMYTMETGSPRRVTRQGFRKYFREVKDDEGNIKKVAAYKAAQYTVHAQERTVILKYELKVVSTETSEVLFSQVEEVSTSDNVEFATSQVPAGSLYPANAQGEVNRSGQRRLSQLLKAPRELRAESAMRQQVVQEAATRGIRDIERFLASHIE